MPDNICTKLGADKWERACSPTTNIGSLWVFQSKKKWLLSADKHRCRNCCIYDIQKTAKLMRYSELQSCGGRVTSVAIFSLQRGWQNHALWSHWADRRRAGPNGAGWSIWEEPCTGGIGGSLLVRETQRRESKSRVHAGSARCQASWYLSVHHWAFRGVQSRQRLQDVRGDTSYLFEAIPTFRPSVRGLEHLKRRGGGSHVCSCSVPPRKDGSLLLHL